jgi:hypothetical protein
MTMPGEIRFRHGLAAFMMRASLAVTRVAHAEQVNKLRKKIEKSEYLFSGTRVGFVCCDAAVSARFCRR